MQAAAILCVDDEEIILNSLESQLRNCFGDRFIYEFCQSADEAHEVITELDAEKIRILIIVSDWLMPGIKGDEFLIQVHKKFPQIVKIILTGQADAAAIERARQQANLHRCIHKPWEEHELIEAIKTGLGDEYE